MKSIHKIALLVVLLLIMATPAFADNNETSNEEEKNSILVPVRFVSDSLDASVKWNQEEQKVTVTQGDKIVEMNIDSSEVYINGNKTVLDNGVTPKLVNKNTMLPLNFLSETFDYQPSSEERKQITDIMVEHRKALEPTNAVLSSRSNAQPAPLVNDFSDVVLKEAASHHGIRYSYGGTSPSTGFDCSGFVQYTYKKAGISLPRTAGAQYSASVKVSRDQAQPGDLVFFRGTYGGANKISHVGIYGDSSTMHHASSSRGISSCSWSSGYWGNHFDSIRRIK